MRKRQVLVIGLGRMGLSIVDELFDTSADVVCVDKRAEAVDLVKDRVAAAYIADGSDPAVLEQVEAHEADVAVITYGEDFEATVMAVSALHALGVSTIVARAATARQATVLRAVGATRVVLIEEEMGRRLAPELLSPAARELAEYASSFRVLPWQPEDEHVGRTLASLELTTRFDIQALGYFRGPPKKQKLPSPIAGTADYTIEHGDTLLLIGLHESIERFLAS